jgi:hypothetical protein
MEGAPLSQFDGKVLDGLQFCSKVYALFESIRNTVMAHPGFDGGRQA